MPYNTYTKKLKIKRYMNTFANYTPKKKYKSIKKIVEGILKTLEILQPIPPHTFFTGNIIEIKKVKGLTKSEYSKYMKENGISENLNTFILRMLRAFGLVEIFRNGKGIRITLTGLGENMKEFINKIPEKELKPVEKVSLYFISGLLFATKARIILLSLLAGAHDFKDIYNFTYPRLFSFEKNFKDVEIIGFEILNELALSDMGRVKDYITDVHIINTALSYLGLINLTSLNTFTINKEGKFVSPSAFMGIYFEIRGNDFMGFGIDKDAVGYTPSYNLPKLYNYGKHIIEMIKILKEKKKEIDIDLRRLYGLP